MFKELISKLQIIFIPCSENNYRPRFLESNVLLYYIVILLALKLIVVLFLVCLPQTIFFTDISRSVLIELTNEERQSLGISSLREDSLLNKAAYLKAQDMIIYSYFSHESPAGTTPWYWFKKAGYNYQIAGENLGIGFLDSEEIYQAWGDSPSHKANLVNPKYEDIGIAVLKGDFNGNETTVVVQLFGSPKIIESVKTGEEPEKEIEEEKIEEKKEEGITELVQKTKEEIEKDKLEGEILGETYLEPFTAEEKDGFKFKFLEFMVLDYSDLVQKITFYSLLLITISLIINIFVRLDIQYKDLILKTALFGTILVLFMFLNKEFIIQLIPHNLGIY